MGKPTIPLYNALVLGGKDKGAAKPQEDTEET